jgi:hypothetical protein
VSAPRTTWVTLILSFRERGMDSTTATTTGICFWFDTTVLHSYVLFLNLRSQVDA